MKGKTQLRKACRKSKLYLLRSSPTILSCIAAAGVVVTAIMAVKATPKAMRLLEAASDEKGEELTKTEIICTVGTVYIPTILIGLSAISCIFGANVLNKRHQATLTSAYALLNQSYRQYRKAAITVYGEDADSKIIAQVARETYISAEGYSLYHPELDRESEDVLFYDSYSQRYFNAPMASVINAQYHINRNLALRGYVSVNEFYEFIGIDGIDGGDELEWSLDELMESGIIWLDFENVPTKMEDGMECYIISSTFSPELGHPDF